MDENSRELKDKIVELSFQLRTAKLELNEVKKENYDRIKHIVHNLKNPIGVAYSFSEMIVEDKNLSPEKNEKYLNVIKDSTKFSIDTLKALASINTLNSSHFSLNKSTVNYIDLIKQSLIVFQKSKKDRNISIQTDFPNEDIFLIMDSFEMEKVFINLLDNAVRFSDNDSSITIKIQKNKENIETLIIDEGIGILNENLPLIFNEFYTVNTYSQDSEKCIGLGLAFVKNILKAHKFNIKVESDFGKGTGFKIIMPLS